MSTSAPMVAARLADRLQVIRKKRGFSLEDLALAASISRSALIGLEQSRHTTPRLTTLVRLAAGLNVDVIDLLAERPAEMQAPDPRDAYARIVAAIRALRSKEGLSQEALSAKLGRFRTFVPRLESRLSNPTLADLEEVAQVLGVPTHSLLDQDETDRRIETLKALKLAESRNPSKVINAGETRAAREAREALKVAQGLEALKAHRARKGRSSASTSEGASPSSHISDPKKSKAKKSSR